MLLMLYSLFLFVVLRHGVVRPTGEYPGYVMMKMWGLGDEEKKPLLDGSRGCGARGVMMKFHSENQFIRSQ